MQSEDVEPSSWYQNCPFPIPVKAKEASENTSNSDADKQEQPQDAAPHSYDIVPLPTPMESHPEDAISNAVDAIMKQPSAISRNTCRVMPTTTYNINMLDLDFLHNMDHVFIDQDVEKVEGDFGGINNIYKVKSSQGKILLVAIEETDCCSRNCCGSLRSFELSMVNKDKHEVILMSSPLACNSWLCPSLQSIVVESPPGTLVGSVVQDRSLRVTQFRIFDANDETKFHIKGPWCLYGNVEFQILSQDGSKQVGKISKQWSDILKEGFTKDKNLGLSFPGDLDVQMKAVLLGALVLIGNVISF